MSDTRRKEAIKQLRRLKADIKFGIASKVENKNQIEALSIAIASLETDEMYDLLYEEPEFCADCISKADALKLNVYAPIAPIVEGENVHWEEIILTEELRKLPSVLPKIDARRKGHWDKEGACPFCDYLRHWRDDNYCAHCGADLRKDG